MLPIVLLILLFSVRSCLTEGLVPTGWNCDDDYYNDSNDCDCDCGAYDIDCDIEGSSLLWCLPFEVCDTAGLCVPGPKKGDPNWICPEDFYNSSDGCDCECGAVDPDCEEEGAVVLNCPEDYVCSTYATCIDPTIVVPSTWTCPPNAYNTSDGCDCGCGAPDPDCDLISYPAYGCDEDQLCEEGICKNISLPPPEWSCPEGYYDRQDGCDCHCGAIDPDCKDYEYDAFNCPCSQMNCSFSLCIGYCEGLLFYIDN